MEKEKIIRVMFFICSLSILVLSFIFFYFIKQDLSYALLSTFLTWSFYILCIPAFHGKIILAIPFWLITGRKFLYPEKYLWSVAILFNIYTFFVEKNMTERVKKLWGEELAWIKDENLRKQVAI